MADYQNKVHPVAVVGAEVKSVTPAPSLTHDPDPPPPPQRLSLNSVLAKGKGKGQDKDGPLHLLPSSSAANYSHHQPMIIKNQIRRSRCWSRVMLWTIIIVALVLLVVGATAGILYLVFRPKLPNYSVDSLKISDLRLLNFGMTLFAKFDVKITATNPNKKIGIYYYQRGSTLSVWYSKTVLCNGSLRQFYQGHRNTTHFHVPLSGQTQYASILMSALREQQQTNRVPLLLKVRRPLRIKLGALKLSKIRVYGTCLLAVDSLSPNTLITIKANVCKFSLHL